MRYALIALLIAGAVLVGALDPLGASFVSFVAAMAAGFVAGQWISFTVLESPWWTRFGYAATLLPVALVVVTGAEWVFWWAVYRVVPWPGGVIGGQTGAVSVLSIAPLATVPAYLVGTLAVNLPTAEEMRKRRDGEE